MHSAGLYESLRSRSGCHEERAYCARHVPLLEPGRSWACCRWRQPQRRVCLRQLGTKVGAAMATNNIQLPAASPSSCSIARNLHNRHRKTTVPRVFDEKDRAIPSMAGNRGSDVTYVVFGWCMVGAVLIANFCAFGAGVLSLVVYFRRRRMSEYVRLLPLALEGSVWDGNALQRAAFLHRRSQQCLLFIGIGLPLCYGLQYSGLSWYLHLRIGFCRRNHKSRSVGKGRTVRCRVRAHRRSSGDAENDKGRVLDDRRRVCRRSGDDHYPDDCPDAELETAQLNRSK